MTTHKGKPNLARRDDDTPDTVLEGEIVTRSGTMETVATQFVTARRVQVPRSLEKVKAACLQEAGFAAEDFMYSWTVQNKDGSRDIIEGMSIDGAMIMLRNWTNCACPVDIIEDAPEHWVFRATFVDLETGLCVPRLFRQRKSNAVGGRMDIDRKLDIAFQIGQSKAQRNAIDKAMPTWLKTACVDASKRAAAAKVKDLPGDIQKMVETFAKLGVTVDQMEKRIGVSKSQWNALDVVNMRATYKAIQDRTTSVENEFPKDEPEKKPEEKPADPPPPSGPKASNEDTGIPHDEG